MTIRRKDIEKLARELAEYPAVNGAENMRGEQRFSFEARERKGHEVYRDGWPDFLTIDPKTGEGFFVEVKDFGDEIRPTQRRMFGALERLGITVYVSPEAPKTLTPWRSFHPAKRAERRGRPLK